LRKRNIKSIKSKINIHKKQYYKKLISYDKIYESFQGSFAYAKHANTYNFRNKLIKKIENYFPNEISSIEINRYIKN